MAYKARTTSTKKKKKKNTQIKQKQNTQKFHLGRNTGTNLIILGGVLLILLIVITCFSIWGKSGYVTVHKENKPTPFQDDNFSDEKYQDITFYEGKDYKEFDVLFECTSFDQDDHAAKFNLTVAKNENTKSLDKINSSLSYSANSSYACYANVCLAADWVNFCSYASTSTPKGFTKTRVEAEAEKRSPLSFSVKLQQTIKTENEYGTTTSKTENVTFPMKANTWPVKVKVDAPEAYVLIAYIYDVNGEKVLNLDVLHYSYSEYITQTTSPVIQKS